MAFKGIIPDTLANMKNLDHLLIYNTSITKVTDRIEKMTSLRVVEMENCSLTSFPDLRDLPRLFFVDVSNNHLSQIILPPSMIMVDITDNNFHEIPVHPNPEKLRLLYMSSNHINDLLSIVSYKNVEALSLKSLDLTSIPSNFDQLEKVQFIDLSNNKLTHFPDVLFKLSQLEYLDIQGNLFPTDQIESIRNAWKKSHPKLELLI